MKNNTNIYDINGELIRSAGDNHKWTIEEAQEKLKKYNELVQNLEKSEDPNSDKNYLVYLNYIRNLSTYILDCYSKMSPEEIQNLISKKNNETTTEEITKAINELKEEVKKEEENEEKTIETSNVESVEESKGTTDSAREETRSQGDLLVDRDRGNIVMDEYVPFTEE